MKAFRDGERTLEFGGCVAYEDSDAREGKSNQGDTMAKKIAKTTLKKGTKMEATKPLLVVR
ncbi:MAG: hypothetical protein WA192_10370 [Candidatus Acidiferrales bacterium]